MHPVQEKKRVGAATIFPSDRVWAKFEVQIDMPRERVWDYLALSEYRNILIGSDNFWDSPRRDKRVNSTTKIEVVTTNLVGLILAWPGDIRFKQARQY